MDMATLIHEAAEHDLNPHEQNSTCYAGSIFMLYHKADEEAVSTSASVMAGLFREIYCILTGLVESFATLDIIGLKKDDQTLGSTNSMHRPSIVDPLLIVCAGWWIRCEVYSGSVLS